ncbi:MAG TPA: hypothetical protein VF963_10350 [Gaiellaceae bacterium]
MPWSQASRRTGVISTTVLPSKPEQLVELGPTRLAQVAQLHLLGHVADRLHVLHERCEPEPHD